MFRLLPTLLLTAAGSGALLLPQDTPPRQDTPGSSQGIGARTDAEKNTVLATFLLVHNKMELELSKLAEQRAQNPEVKQFAQKMVADHTALGQKLQTFATSVAGRTPGGAQPGRPAEAGAGRTGAPGQMDFDHTSLIEELGNEFLQSARGELEKKQGAEFDHCYVGMAVAAHMKADDMMTVFERHASGELASAIREAHPKIEQHLAEAKRLAESVKQK